MVDMALKKLSALNNYPAKKIETMSHLREMIQKLNLIINFAVNVWGK